MTVEAEIFNALQGLAGGRCYFDIAPDVPSPTVLPYITFQQVGGEAINFIDATLPGKRNFRMQINIWGNTRTQVSALAKQVEDALRLAASLQTTVIGAPIALYEPDTKLRGSIQDFSMWGA